MRFHVFVYEQAQPSQPLTLEPVSRDEAARRLAPWLEIFRMRGQQPRVEVTRHGATTAALRVFA